MPRSTPEIDYTDPSLYAETILPVEAATTLLPAAYRDEAFADVERDRVWRRSWVCVGYTSQLPEAGDILTADVADQPIMIVRGQDGDLRGFYNVCRHRGCQLIDESQTNCRVIRCPCHSWGYGLNGELLGAPYFAGLSPEELSDQLKQEFDTTDAEASGFRREDFSLLPVHVETWGCFVFVNLDPHPRPLSDWLGDLPQRYARHRFEELQLYQRLDYEIQANWKLVAENFMEYYHLPWVHPELCNISGFDNHQRYQGPGMYMGMCTSPLSVAPDTVTFDLPLFAGIDETEAISAYFVLLFPNLALWIFPNHVVTLLYRPSSATSTLEHMDMLLHPTALAKTDIAQRCKSVLEFYDMVNQQDVAIVERVQRGLRAREYPGGRMCFQFEEPVHRFQNMVIDLMTSDGREKAVSDH